MYVRKFEKVVDRTGYANAIALEMRNPESTEILGKFNLQVNGKQTLWGYTTSDTVAETFLKDGWTETM